MSAQNVAVKENGRNIRRDKGVLILAVLAAGLCSLVYELLISTASSYFLGDSIRQFSVTIGLYLASMGLGAYLSRLLRTRLLLTFVGVELLLGLSGGLCVPLLYLAYAYGAVFWPVVVLLIVVIGALTGLEIPLLTRLMDEQSTRKAAREAHLSNVLSFDYLGALLATLAFPFVLLPLLGTFRSSLVMGLLNVGVGVLLLRWFADATAPRRRRLTYGAGAGVALLLAGLLALAGPLLKAWGSGIYEDRIVYMEQTPYQRIVMTRWRNDLRLYLNGSLQFSSLDERRYHEALVHVPMSQAERRQRVLILGGGDGLAAREILKYGAVEAVTVVDLDTSMFRLARTRPSLIALNDSSFHSPRLRTRAQDAFTFLDETRRTFDVILADLPDPNDVSLARLYSRAFYKLVAARLAPGGVFVTQATSPYFARKAFWCIRRSIEAGGFPHVYPYHTNVPSLGEWGFVMASKQPKRPASASVPVRTRYLNDATVETLFAFPKDLLPPEGATAGQVSTLDRPRVLTHYLNGWRNWN